MTKLRVIELRDSSHSYHHWRHCPAVVDFMCILALKKCKIETKGFSKVNVYCSDRNEIEQPWRFGTADVHVKCDVREFRGERANHFGFRQIDRAMRALEAAGHIRKGSQQALKKEVLGTRFEWTGPVSRWIRPRRRSDAFRVMASTAHNGFQLDAQLRFADGVKASLPLLRTRSAPDHITNRFENVTWKSARSIELCFWSDRGSHRTQFYGLRALDSRGMKDLEAEISQRTSVTFRYSLDRIRPPAVKKKSATKPQATRRKRNRK